MHKKEKKILSFIYCKQEESNLNAFAHYVAQPTNQNEAFKEPLVHNRHFKKGVLTLYEDRRVDS